MNIIDYLKEVQLSDIKGEQRNIAESIGLEAFKKLCQEYGGEALYISKGDQICIEARNRMIMEEFDGQSMKKIATKYRLSERHVRDIINKKFRE